jgi:hypothetical protein
MAIKQLKVTAHKKQVKSAGKKAGSSSGPETEELPGKLSTKKSPDACLPLNVAQVRLERYRGPNRY